MRRALPLLLLATCTQYREVALTFGDQGLGLDGFLCKEPGGRMMLDRLGADAGTAPASIVTDLVDIENGQPGCRTGQLIEWCRDHKCSPKPTTRICLPVQLPTGVTTLPREDVRAKVKAELTKLSGEQVVGDAPDEFVILRMVATGQPCDELNVQSDGGLPEFDTAQLVGCVYSCPTLFDRAPEEVYMGFETLTVMCEQGVRICSSSKLDWVP